MHALDIYNVHRKSCVSLNLLAVTINSKCINASGLCLTGSRDFLHKKIVKYYKILQALTHTSIFRNL